MTSTSPSTNRCALRQRRGTHQHVGTWLDTADRAGELMQMLGATTAAGRRSVEEMLAEVDQAKSGQ
ncbi:MAG: hypothetical protein R2851_21855 [Caldilineaceae bacterium]